MFKTYINSPPTSFIEYILEIRKACYRIKEGVVYPCMECEGYGKVRDPDYVPMYESRPDYVMCTDCQGTGQGTEEQWLEEYQREKIKYTNKILEIKKARELAKSILSKLNKEELDFIKQYCGRDINEGIAQIPKEIT